MQETIPLTLPVTLGGDVAGVVEAVGATVKNLKAGDKVYGQANVVAGASGALAEFALTAPESLAVIPDGLNFDEAAAMPLVGVSAVQGVIEHLGVKSGQKLFIHGGAGGIGSIAIQIAKKASLRNNFFEKPLNMLHKITTARSIGKNTSNHHRYANCFEQLKGGDLYKTRFLCGFLNQYSNKTYNKPYPKMI